MQEANVFLEPSETRLEGESSLQVPFLGFSV